MRVSCVICVSIAHPSERLLWRLQPTPWRGHKSAQTVEMCEIVAHESLRDGHLDEGCLLRWLDLATCACAERHTRVHCVTASVSDLVFGEALSSKTAVGSIITIIATPVRAGNTSLDILVTATAESPASGDNRTVCRAFFTYVTVRGTDGKRPKVPPLLAAKTVDDGEEIAHTAEDWLAFVAQERLVLAQPLQRLDSLRMQASTSAATFDAASWVSTSQTKVEMCELCLPSNLNHMSHTFGGEVMRWMMKAALVCVSRHLGHSVRLRACSGAAGKGDGRPVGFRAVAIDNISFLDSSETSDHLVFRAHINRVFTTDERSECEIEVSVRKWSMQAGCETPINTGHIYMAAEEPVLSEVGPIHPADIADEAMQDAFAQAPRRRAMLAIRRQVLSYGGGPMTFEPALVREIALLNLGFVMRVFSMQTLHWSAVPLCFAAPLPALPHVPGLAVHAEACHSLFGEDISLLRICASVDGPLQAREVFDIAINTELRPKWDTLCTLCEVVDTVDVSGAGGQGAQGVEAEEQMGADITRLQIALGNGGVDFSLMRAWQKPKDHSRGTFVYASRSIEHPNVPPPDCDGLVRGVMLPSGIIAKNVRDASTRSVHRGVDVTLVYQVESAVLQGMLRGMTIEHLSSVFAVSLATMLQLALDR